MRSRSGWRPTAAHVRAVVVALVGVGIGIQARRPDIVVAVAPLAIIAAWSAAVRPTRVPEVRQSLGNAALTEGQVTAWRLDVVDDEGRVDDLAIVVQPPEVIDTEPEGGQRAISLRDDPSSELTVALRPTRWGRYSVLPGLVVASSAWGAHRAVVPDGSSRRLVALPRAAEFDAAAPPVQTPGLVGSNRSPRPGSGTEFATIRPFQPGDRLRRIHWPQTMRTGVTHVRSTWADHDRHVQILVDAFSDLGFSEGVDGAESSLDIAVRAGAAIARHHITAGDRVSLVVLDGRNTNRVPPASGRRHLRRILETLAGVSSANRAVDSGAVPRGVGQAELVVLLSPLMSVASMTRAVTLADRGIHVVTVDCLPPQMATGRHADEYADLAWRIELLERERRVRIAREAGIAVVAWAGPGSLDRVLRERAKHGGGMRVGRR